MNRRTFLKATALSGASTVFITKSVKAQPKLTLRMMNMETDPNTVAMLKQAATDYEAKRGIRFEIDTIPADGAFTKLSTSIKAGRPYDVANILFIGDVLLLAKAGTLVPLTPIIDKFGREDFGPRILFPMDGQIWWYPYDYNFANLYYRKDVFAQKGISEPRSWDQLLKAAQACVEDPKKTGTPDRYGICLPVGSGPAANWLTFGFLWAEGFKLFDDQWRVLIDSPQMKPKLVAYLKFFDELYKTMPPGMAQIGFAENLTLFASEKVAMAAYSGRMIHHLERFAPQLTDKFGMMAYPNSDGSRSAVNHGYDGWVVPKGPNSEEGYKFLDWFLTERLIDFYETLILHYQPTRWSVYENARWKAHPLVKKYPQAVDTMKSFLKGAIIGSIDTEGPAPDTRPGKIFEGFVFPEMVQNVVLRKLPPERAVDLAAEKAKKLIA